MIYTDHGALTWIQNFKEPDGQLAWWLEKFQEFQFTIIHQPEKRHNNADALSRIPCRQCGRSLHVTTDPAIPPVQDTPEEIQVSAVNLLSNQGIENLYQTHNVGCKCRWNTAGEESRQKA